MIQVTENRLAPAAYRWLFASPALLLLMLLLLGGCSSPRQPDHGTGKAPVVVQPAAGARDQAVVTAISLIGKPYRYGGSGPSSFDCSGLVQYSFRTAGVRVPRTSRDQFSAVTAISLASAEPGDLLFFRYNNRISHVAIYLGDLRFVHAPSSGKQVEVASLQDPHYRQHFVQAGRIR